MLGAGVVRWTGRVVPCLFCLQQFEELFVGSSEQVGFWPLGSSFNP